MPQKSAAPRKKAKSHAAPRELRGTKLTCSKRLCNTDKWNLLEPLFGRVCRLKNQMSSFVQANVLSVLSAPYALKSEYKTFASDDLNAWERQALFQDIVGDYQRSVSQSFKAHPFKLQKGLSFSTYQRQVTKKQPDGSTTVIAKVGQPKDGSFVLHLRSTPLTALANYLLRVNIALFDPNSLKDEHPLKAAFLRVAQDIEKWERLKHVARLRQVRLLRRQKTVRYVSGTFRVNPAESRMEVFVDESNKEHQLWLKFRAGLGKTAQFHYLPLQANQLRLNSIADGDVLNLGLDKELRLKLTQNRKLHVCTVYEAPAPEFLPENDSLGLDLNTKRSFATDSTGATYRLDELVLSIGVALLTKIDKEGGVSQMHYRRAAQLRQWLRRNEAHIKKLLARWCNEWAAAGITELWLEDLSMSNDATFLKHPALGEKYSRVLRLMRLSGVKNWLLSIAEKRGVRLHTTNPAYTSQTCPACQHISRKNRPTQAKFQCELCGFEGDADHVAGQNILARGSPALRELLHVEDAHGRCSPRRMHRSVLKAHLGFKAPVGKVTELPVPT